MIGGHQDIAEAVRNRQILDRFENLVTGSVVSASSRALFNPLILIRAWDGKFEGGHGRHNKLMH